MAASGRIYTFGFTAVSATAVQDLLAVYAGVKVLALQSVVLNQRTITTPTALGIRIRYISPTVTPGSGGSSALITPFAIGDAAAVATARTNDTVGVSSSTTTFNLWNDDWNLLNGFLWVPPNINRPPVGAPQSCFVVSLDTAATMTINGSMTFEEFP